MGFEPKRGEYRYIDDQTQVSHMEDFECGYTFPWNIVFDRNCRPHINMRSTVHKCAEGTANVLVFKTPQGLRVEIQESQLLLFKESIRFINAIDTNYIPIVTD